MFEINVTLTIPGLPEAINNLAQSISNGKITQGAAGVTQPLSVSAPAQPAQSAAPGNPTPVPAPAPAPPAVPAVPSAPAPSNSVPSIDAISVAGALLCEKGKMPQLLALLRKYGVQAVAQLKDRPAETLNAFSAELRALGANI